MKKTISRTIQSTCGVATIYEEATGALHEEAFEEVGAFKTPEDVLKHLRKGIQEGYQVLKVDGVTTKETLYEMPLETFMANAERIED